MKTKRQIKNFVLKTLLPYKEDPSTCGYDKGKNVCKYLTKEGKKCALGKWMKKGPWQDSGKDAYGVLDEYTQEEILLKPALEMNFSQDVWENIQDYHDKIAQGLKRGALNALGGIEYILEIDLPELRF
jgi:hypothetical protein